MARPVTISDDRILDAARRVILERGFAATTAEVARQAGVAEGSLFKRWKTKEALFHAALAPDDQDPDWIRDLASRVGKGDVQTTLTEVGMKALVFFRQLMPLVMMCWSNPSANGVPMPFDTPNPKPLRVLKKLAGYFEAEMQKNRLAHHDAEVLARTFLGGIQQFAFLELVSRASEELPMPAEMFIRGLVHLLWNGAKPVSVKHPKEIAR